MRHTFPVLSMLLISALSLPAAVEGSKSKVQFLSNPPGATVVDAALGELGTTPFRLNIKRKTVLDCTFTKKGYASRTVTQEIDSLHAVVRGDLKPLPMTTVRLGVQPRNASIRLATLEDAELYSGIAGHVLSVPGVFWGDDDTARFHVEAWAPGYRRLEQEVELTRHEAHELDLALLEVSTLLVITSDTEGVRITNEYLGGGLGLTPLESRVSLVQLLRARSRLRAPQGDPGQLVLTVSKPGYVTRAERIEIDFERAENAFKLKLEPAGGG